MVNRLLTAGFRGAGVKGETFRNLHKKYFITHFKSYSLSIPNDN